MRKAATRRFRGILGGISRFHKDAMTIPEIANGAYRPAYSSLPIKQSVAQDRNQSAKKFRETLDFLRNANSTDFYSSEHSSDEL